MIKKIISVVLCFSFIVSLVTVYTPVARAVGGDIDIYTEDGACVTSLTLDYYEKTTLTAVARDFDIIDCQWQFLLGGRSGIWVDIYDMTEPVCELSRAVVGNMLDSDGEAYIRCIVDYDGGAYYSDAVTVTVGKPDVSDPPHVSSFVSMPVAESGLVSFESDVSVYTPVKRTYMTDGSDLIDGHAEDVEYVTVTIKYLDEASLTGEEGAIYSPYVATIEKGSAFSQTVVSPTFIGFAPYYDSDTTDGDTEADDDASSITFNYDAVNENIEIKVYYKPIEVNFYIKYFFQNINGDLYTEDLTRFHSGKALTGTIISDEYIKEKAGNTVGFEKMYHIPESVAADGSTVFECYYDRKYYLLQFDLNGGYGVDPIYARYGTAFIVNSPIKHGYQFMGWDLLTIDSDSNGVPDKGDGVVNNMDATIPAENRYYKAVWQSVDTSYNVVYWVQNPDDPDTVAPGDAGATLEFIGSRKVGEKSGAIVSGYNDLSSYNVYVCGNYTHTHTSACKSDVVLDRLEYYGADTNVLVDGDGSTVVNVYYRYNQYKLRFIFAKTDITSTIASNHTHWVVGGTTYPFGTYIDQTAENTPLETLLENVTQWGQVTVKTTRNTGMPITDGSGSQLTDANGNKLYYGTPEDMVSDSYKNYISGGIKPISIGS
ncbi:MAG: hypothetical protein IKV54_02525, partial [Clostridia bacterium]|nr:hypothetical protein [Clostridia bacterium]